MLMLLWGITSIAAWNKCVKTWAFSWLCKCSSESGLANQTSIKELQSCVLPPCLRWTLGLNWSPQQATRARCTAASFCNKKLSYSNCQSVQFKDLPVNASQKTSQAQPWESGCKACCFPDSEGPRTQPGKLWDKGHGCGWWDSVGDPWWQVQKISRNSIGRS